MVKKPPEKIVCLGDSLTLAFGDAELNKWPTRVASALEREFPGRYELFIRAWNGATTYDALQRIDKEVGFLLPATVVVAYGVNEAHIPAHRRSPQIGVGEFEDNLREIHRYVAATGGRTIFVVQHVPQPSAQYAPGNGRTYAENYEPYRQAIPRVARGLGSPVVDVPGLLAAGNIGAGEILVEDGLHLSTTGNGVYADLIFKGIIPFLTDFR